MKIFILNGSKVWLDPEKAPADAIPYGQPEKKAQPVKTEPEKVPTASAAPETKAKKTPANKARKAGGNK